MIQSLFREHIGNWVPEAKKQVETVKGVGGAESRHRTVGARAPNISLLLFGPDDPDQLYARLQIAASCGRQLWAILSGRGDFGNEVRRVRRDGIGLLTVERRQPFGAHERDVGDEHRLSRGAGKGEVVFTVSSRDATKRTRSSKTDKQANQICGTARRLAARTR